MLLAAWYAPGPTVLSVLLLPIAAVYRLLTSIRRALYRRGVLASVRVGVPVVVIGNLTAGGTGKTPLVRHLAAALLARGFRPGVVSRGYGRSRGRRRAERRVRTVDSAAATLVRACDAPAAVGDEPLLYVADGLPVAVGADRVAAARLLLRAHPEVDVVLSDDGLQHYRLARDVEIAVVDGERGFGNGWPLPAGPLREPRSRLASVDAVVCNAAMVPAFARCGPPVFGMHLVPELLRNLADPARTQPAAHFRGTPVRAIAGIGRPERFFALLRGLGLEVREQAFPDHHRFVPADLAGDAAVPVLMTEKDAVKCRAFADSRFWAVPVSARLEPTLAPLVEEKIRGSKVARDSGLPGDQGPVDL